MMLDAATETYRDLFRRLLTVRITQGMTKEQVTAAVIQVLDETTLDWTTYADPEDGELKIRVLTRDGAE